MINAGQQRDRPAAVSLATRILFALRMGRPHFLIGGLLLHWLGVAMALSVGAPLSLPALLWGQAVVTAAQLMTHYSKDYFDLAADRANPTPTDWSGGSRVLPEGWLAPRLALRIAIGLGIFALGLAVVLAIAVQPGVQTFLLIAVALLLAWSYSAPPLRLHSRGVGELATALLVPGLTPLVGFYLQTGRPGRRYLACCRSAACNSPCCWRSSFPTRSAMRLWVSAPWWCGWAEPGPRASMRWPYWRLTRCSRCWLVSGCLCWWRWVWAWECPPPPGRPGGCGAAPRITRHDRAEWISEM